MEYLNGIGILIGIGIFLSLLLLRIAINIYTDEKWFDKLSQRLMHPDVKQEVERENTKQENIGNSTRVKE